MPKFKIKGKKETFDTGGYRLTEVKDSKPKMAKIKIGKLSDVAKKPMKKGKLIIRKSKGTGKYVKDEQYYKTKMMKAKTASDEMKYFKLMRKMMDK